MRKLQLCFVLTIAAFATVPVSAQISDPPTYVFCFTNETIDREHSTTLVSNIYTVDTYDQEGEKEAMEAFVKKQVGIPASKFIEPRCYQSRDKAQVEKVRKLRLTENSRPGESHPRIEVNWPLKPGSQGQARGPKQATGPGSLIVEENTAARDAIELAEKQRMEMLKKTAADKARMVAVSAASKAERDRLRAKMIAEMKKRGNKQ